VGPSRAKAARTEGEARRASQRPESNPFEVGGATVACLSDLETFECANCGDTFTAHPSADAAQHSYRSPVCETAGKGLAG
jgi:hypothetical protein